MSPIPAVSSGGGGAAAYQGRPRVAMRPTAAASASSTWVRRPRLRMVETFFGTRGPELQSLRARFDDVQSHERWHSCYESAKTPLTSPASVLESPTSLALFPSECQPGFPLYRD